MSTATPTLVIPERPDRADREIILARLADCEEAVAGPLNLQPLAILIKDEAGRTIGGLWGTSLFRWLIVELLFVPDGCRGAGLGTTIMHRAEAIARQRGCIGIWLDTYSFQAPDFYRRLGFESFGRVEDQPPGAVRHFMLKRLAPEVGRSALDSPPPPPGAAAA